MWWERSGRETGRKPKREKDRRKNGVVPLMEEKESGLPTARISTKGQIVIPKYLRDAINLKEGDSVFITKVDDKIMIMKKPDDPAKALAESGKSVNLKNIRREIKEE